MRTRRRRKHEQRALWHPGRFMHMGLHFHHRDTAWCGVIHKWLRPATVIEGRDNSDVSARPAPCVPALAWGRARVNGSAVLEALENKCVAVQLLQQQQGNIHDPAGETSLAHEDSVSITDVSIDPEGDRSSQQASKAETRVEDTRQRKMSTIDASPVVPGAPPRQPTNQPTLLRRSADSTLPPGSGVVTQAPVPVLARAWGNRLQLLQVQPAGLPGRAYKYCY